jgi:hypothetical protein
VLSEQPRHFSSEDEIGRQKVRRNYQDCQFCGPKIPVDRDKPVLACAYITVAPQLEQALLLKHA